MHACVYKEIEAGFGGNQAAKESAAAEAQALRQEVEQVMVRHQERVTKWEAAVADDEAQLAARRAALQVLNLTL